MGKFIVSKRSNGEFQFNLASSNGKVILSSEGYTTNDGCLNGIESVKKNGLEPKNYESKTSTNGKYFFNLKAANGQVIGTSQMYEDESSRDKGIESVTKTVSEAELEHQEV